MINQAAPFDSDDTRCWQCGAAASAECAYPFTLVADSRRGLDALAYPVSRESRLDKLRVSVPRCASCRSRSRVSMIVVFGGAVAGGILLPGLRRMFWPGLTMPTWLHQGYWRHEGIGGPTFATGLVLGFVIALLGVAWQRRRLGLRSLNSYPPIKMLRQAGWHYPE